MLTASVSRRFDIPADKLWDLIGDFGNMAKWTSASLMEKSVSRLEK